MRMCLVLSCTWLSACMQISEILTQDSEGAVYGNFQGVLEDHAYFANEDTRMVFQLLPDFENLLTETLRQHKVTAPAEVEYVQKILHKVRSMRAYGYYTRCFVVPGAFSPEKSEHKDLRQHAPRWWDTKQLQSDWRKRYDLTMLDDKRFCYLYLSKMKELMPGQLDLNQKNNAFYDAVLANKTQSPTATPPEVQARRKKFRQVLLSKIIAATEAAMGKNLRLFVFETTTLDALCREKFPSPGPGLPSNPYRNLNQQVCAQLNHARLLAIEQYREKIPGRVDTMLPRSFTSATELTAELNAIIAKLNEHRTALNAILQEAGATQKRGLVLPWFKLINEANLSDYEVVKKWEEYMNTAVEYAKDGYLPLLFSDALQKQSGDVHLNRRGRWLGFGKVELSLLKQVDDATTTKAVVELKEQLVSSWLELRDKEQETYTGKEGEHLFQLAISHELSVAQLLMQQPEHAVTLNHLLLDYQFDSCTPKWLRAFQNASMAIDLAFIPVVLLAGFISGGAAIVPLMLIANAVNFLWVGVSHFRERVAANRYKMLQRALLSGNSTQVAEGLKRLEKLHRNRKEMIVSGTLGSGLTLANMKFLTHHTQVLATTVVDVKAGIDSDYGGVTSDDDRAEIITGDRGESCLQRFLRK